MCLFVIVVVWCGFCLFACLSVCLDFVAVGFETVCFWSCDLPGLGLTSAETTGLYHHIGAPTSFDLSHPLILLCSMVLNKISCPTTPLSRNISWGNLRVSSSRKNNRMGHLGVFLSIRNNIVGNFVISPFSRSNGGRTLGVSPPSRNNRGEESSGYLHSGELQ